MDFPKSLSLVQNNREKRGLRPLADDFTREQYLQLINWKLAHSVGMTAETRAMHVEERKAIMAELAQERASGV